MHTMEKYVKEYAANIRKTFPKYGKKEKMYVRHLLVGVQEYILVHPICSLDELENVFGTPAEIVSSYWSEMNSEELVQEMRQNDRIRKLIYSGITVAVVVWLVFCGTRYYIYRDALKANVAYTEIYIDDSEQN